MYTLHVISLNFTGNPCSIPAKSNSLQILQRKSECGYFKITGIAGIHTIPVIIACTLQGIPWDTGYPHTFYGGNICSVVPLSWLLSCILTQVGYFCARGEPFCSTASYTYYFCGMYTYHMRLKQHIKQVQMCIHTYIHRGHS